MTTQLERVCAVHVLLLVCFLTTASLSKLRRDILQRMLQREDDVAVVIEACPRL